MSHGAARGQLPAAGRCGRPAKAVLLALLCLLPAAAAQAAPSLDQLTTNLQRAGRQVRTLSARFVQRKQLKLFKSAITTRGKLLYRRPDQLRWETLAPDASVVLVHGKRAELRIPGEAPRTLDLRRSPALGALIDQVLVWMGSRPASGLARWYEVQIQSQSGNTRVTLVPKHDAIKRQVQRADVWLDSRWRLQRIELAHPGGDRTRITFDAMQVNKPLPAAAFH